MAEISKMPKVDGPALIPPVGSCAICHRGIPVTADRVTVSFDVFRNGKPTGTRYEVHACNDAHAAEALRRLAAAVEAKSLPKAGSPEWARGHGVLVAED